MAERMLWVSRPALRPAARTGLALGLWLQEEVLVPSVSRGTLVSFLLGPPEARPVAHSCAGRVGAALGERQCSPPARMRASSQTAVWPPAQS